MIQAATADVAAEKGRKSARPRSSTRVGSAIHRSASTPDVELAAPAGRDRPRRSAGKRRSGATRVDRWDGTMFTTAESTSGGRYQEQPETAMGKRSISKQRSLIKHSVVSPLPLELTKSNPVAEDATAEIREAVRRYSGGLGSWRGPHTQSSSMPDASTASRTRDG